MPIKSAVMVSRDEVSVSIAKALLVLSLFTHSFRDFSDKTVSYSFLSTSMIEPSKDWLGEDLTQFLNSSEVKSLFNSS